MPSRRPISNGGCGSWRRALHRAIDKRLARVEAPAVAHRRALRACAAIGAAQAAILAESPLARASPNSVRWSILRLGEEAAAELAAIPDTPDLQALDRVHAAACPPQHGDAPPPIARRMLLLIERYRRECGLDHLDRDARLAELAARAAARAGQEAAPADPSTGGRA